MIPALLAALLAGLGQLLGWRGVDMAAQVYRVESFHRFGFSLWDLQWYGGHWTLDYSLLYPPVAGAIGVGPLAVASAGLAALAFDRLARRHLGPGGVAASYVFAAGTLVQVSIGQLTFLTGEALALCAAWAVSRGRYRVAAALGLACPLVSPVAGGFLALAMAAWLLCRWRAGAGVRSLMPAAAVGLAALTPLVAASLLFPGDGPMPYPAVDYGWEMTVAAALVFLAWRDGPEVRAGGALFMAVATVSFVVPSPLGGNIGRIEDVLALPVAVALLWVRARLVLPLAAAPLALSQWGPAWGALTASPAEPSTHASYFAPLDARLQGLSREGPAGRVEVVPTAYHWEAAYVAPVMPLARGWERQLDVADNAIFYRSGPLDPTAYHSWLIDNGVRFVALPAAPLDSAGRSEAALVRSGTVPGLRQIWRSPDWRLYVVAGSAGIVSQPAQLVSASGGRVVVDTPTAGSVLIRVRYSPDWTLASGTGCVARSGSSWLSVDVPQPEQFSLELSLLGDGDSPCRLGSLSLPARAGPAP